MSPEIIGDAGLALSRAGEPFGVNAIARHLGVRSSSLYNHVDGMDGIVELMRVRLLATYRVDLPRERWEEYVLAMLRAQRQAYADHPSLVPLLVGKTMTSPTVVEAYDDLATVLADGGFLEEEILSIIAVLDAFAIGFGLDLAAPDDIWQPNEETRTLRRLLESGERGRARADHTFELGVSVLMDSLRARLTNT
ncbi:TetR/AcrR family transcriptional regulator C-terminal domain-containing protein [Paenarthrobacter nicotinovorans]|uniref:TetR/AcrR family transcriptional regulator C-terminal domain-containing protein n=1 Tax=Paenarthrobacter nicotinovorans TaxID=29320 RepID=A0ABV0GX69_PAENI|nr:TetR/AcrR family transcriptional regulator C-terminal domain-containing protein [Paenarthrobacter nicotinovorans]